jgi:hypothetical protein
MSSRSAPGKKHLVRSRSSTTITRAGRALSAASIVPFLFLSRHLSWQLFIFSSSLFTDLPCASAQSDISPDLLLLLLQAAGLRAKQRSAAVTCRINRRARQGIPSQSGFGGSATRKQAEPAASLANVEPGTDSRMTKNGSQTKIGGN